MRVGAPSLTHLSVRQHSLLSVARLRGWRVAPADADLARGHATDAVAFVAGDDAEASALRRACPMALGIGASEHVSDVDIVVPDGATEGMLAGLLEHAQRFAELRAAARRHEVEAAQHHQRIRQLADIGIALSAERDPVRLLETILTEARRLADCDAGSLYLIEERQGAPVLQFKLAQNDSTEVQFKETRLPLTPESLCGYVALTGSELNIADAYRIEPSQPYAFNRSFDERAGYRTVSLLVLPMRDHRDRVIGVLQFINRRAGDEFAPFDDDVIEPLRAIASQAAVAIQKNDLLRQIGTLFESFVQASVKAIEQRDPSTRGHSLRVADTTTALLAALPRSGLPRFRNLVIRETDLVEVRYAALLHDFGKVGVRENVLVKAKKLPDARLEVIRYRVELQKERLRRTAAERELAALHANPSEFERARLRIRHRLDADIARLDDFVSAIVHANDPTVVADGDFGHLDEIRRVPFVELDGAERHLIDDDDLLALSVRRGSLTPAERREIEAHVSFTRDFLSVLPWPAELAGVPLIAGAHHEKLDGSGYPDGRRGDEIPLPSRVMTVCDIYDALTAMDRPYKAAISSERAFDILREEASAGLIDADIVGVFIASRATQRPEGAASPRTREPLVTRH